MLTFTTGKILPATAVVLALGLAAPFAALAQDAR